MGVGVGCEVPAGGGTTGNGVQVGVFLGRTGLGGWEVRLVISRECLALENASSQEILILTEPFPIKGKGIIEGPWAQAAKGAAWAVL